MTLSMKLLLGLPGAVKEKAVYPQEHPLFPPKTRHLAQQGILMKHSLRFFVYSSNGSSSVCCQNVCLSCHGICPSVVCAFLDTLCGWALPFLHEHDEDSGSVAAVTDLLQIGGMISR